MRISARYTLLDIKQNEVILEDLKM